MARIELEDERVSVHMTPLDEILSLHGILHLPYSHIRAVNTDPVPSPWFAGFRIGTNIPGVKMAGTFIGGQGIVFYDFHDPKRCLTFELAHQHYKRVVVQVDEDQKPELLAVQIRERIEGANV